MEQEVVLVDALPGVWRDQPRLYVDSSTTLYSVNEAENLNLPELTRLGLLRTRANVKGHVIGIRRRSALALTASPEHADPDALGRASRGRGGGVWRQHQPAITELRPGDGVAMTGLNSVGVRVCCNCESTTEKHDWKP